MIYRLVERAPIVLILFWLVASLVAAPFALKLDEYVKADTKSFLPEGTESVRAEEAIAELGVGGPAAATAIIVVDGVSPDAETYRGMKDWYPGLRSEYGLLSWYDAVEAAEERLSQELAIHVLRAAQAYEAADKLYQGYLAAVDGLAQASEALPRLAFLLAKADEGYVGLLGARQDLEALAASLEPLGEGALGVYSVVEAYAAVYLDVVRAEALLEGYTNAYEIGLNDVAVAIVVSKSRVEGLNPLEPELVAAVYNYTVSIGGPEEWSNVEAARLAGALLSEKLEGEAAAWVRVVEQAWMQAVKEAPDLRAPILLDDRNGQLQVARIVFNSILPGAWSSVAGVYAEEVLSQLPPGPEKRVVEAYLGVILESSRVDEEVLARALEAAVAAALEARGVPGEYAARLAKAFVDGDDEAYRRAALEAAAVIAAEASQGAVTSDEVAAVLVKYDSQGQGVLVADRQLQLRAAAELLSGKTGLPAEIILEAYRAGPERAAVRLVLEKASQEGEEAARLAEAIFSEGPPGSREEALARAKALVASAIIEAGAPEGLADAIAEAGLQYYLGASLEEASRLAVEAGLPAVVEKVVEELKGVLVARDASGFIIIVTGDASYDEVKDLEALVEEKLGGDAKSTGGEVIQVEVREAALRDVERSDRVSIVLVLVILAALLGSVLGVLLPFIGIGAGIVVASAVAWLLAGQGLIDVTSMGRALMFTTGLGLGIDYSAYIARRFREFSRGALSPGEAAAKALKVSWRPVMAGALAAAAGFGSLILAYDFPFVASIGYTVPLSILAVMLASLTLTPALLAVTGFSGALWWPTCPYKPHELGAGVAGSLASAAARLAPIIVVLVAGAALLAGLYAAGYEGSYDVRISLPSDAPALQALNTIIEKYDAGKLFPLYVVASTPEKAEGIAEKLAGLECVASTRIEAGRVVIVELDVYPLDKEGLECAGKVREEAKAIDPEALVGGQAAVNLDLRNAMFEAFYNRVLPAAAILIFLVVLFFYASLPAALAAVATIGVAALWSIALVAYLAEPLGYKAPWYLPIVVIAALLGVGMDYNSFFLNSAREAFHSGSRDWVVKAARHGSALVVGLALIMAGAYAGLTLSTSEALRVMGAALALGVLLAGVNSALLLTPSLMALLGRYFWWPKSGVKRSRAEA